VTDGSSIGHQTVKKGQALFVIDQRASNWRCARARPRSPAPRRKLDEEGWLGDKRNHNLGNLVSTELLQQGATREAQAKARAGADMWRKIRAKRIWTADRGRPVTAYHKFELRRNYASAGARSSPWRQRFLTCGGLFRGKPSKLPAIMSATRLR